MKYLVDNPLSPQIAMAFRERGLEAIHVREIGMAAASDESILQRALEEDRCVVTCDMDFGTLLALSGLARPSIITIRKLPHWRPEFVSEVLLRNLPSFLDALERGSAITIYEDRVRIRPLPILDTNPRRSKGKPE